MLSYDFDLAGVGFHLALQALGTSTSTAFWAGMILVVTLRVLAIRWRLHLPKFGKST